MSDDLVTRGLDELAGLADHDAIGDRMDGIRHKARAARNRRRLAGAAGLVVVAAAAAGVVSLLPGRGPNEQPTPPGPSPSVATTASPQPSPQPSPNPGSQTSVNLDIDGDGRDDSVLLRPPYGGSPAFAVVRLASGEKTDIPLVGSGLPSLGGTADLDGDGVLEVQVVMKDGDQAWWTVLVHSGRQVVAATTVGMGEQDVDPVTGKSAGGWWQHTWMRDGHLTSWFALPEWDGNSPTSVEMHDWLLDSDAGQLMLDPGEAQEACVAGDRSSWSDPQPC